MTPWFPGTVKPVRDGAYLRDYTGTEIGGWYMDYWMTEGGVGFWYVNEPKGQWNDANYTELPWRGVTELDYLMGEI